jgi:hypothetical protein
MGLPNAMYRGQRLSHLTNGSSCVDGVAKMLIHLNVAKVCHLQVCLEIHSQILVMTPLVAAFEGMRTW